MAKELPSRTPDDPLNIAGAEWAARVEWVKTQIADACYVPRMPPKPWAGRDAMLAGVAERFGIPMADAVNVVDAAVMELSGAEDDEDPTTIYKRTMLLRLIGIRRMVHDYMQNGRVETTFKWTEPAEGEEPKKVPFKEKQYRGVDMAAIGRLLELERNIAQLQGLSGPEEGVGSLSLIEEIDNALDGNARKRVVVSLAQKIKNGKIENLSPEGQKMLGAALEEMSKRPAKQVESEVVEPEDDEDEEDSE